MQTILNKKNSVKAPRIAVYVIVIAFIFIPHNTHANDLSDTEAPNSRIHLGFLGLTIHGVIPDSTARQYMPRKIDSAGIMVQHPELSLTYFAENSQQFNVTYLRDCMDKPAVNLGWGKYSRYENWRAGFLLSLYARERFHKTAVIEYEDGTRVQKDVRAQQFLFSTTINNWEYIFLPMLTLSYEIPVYKEVSMVVTGGSNFALTHITLGIGF